MSFPPDALVVVKNLFWYIGTLVTKANWLLADVRDAPNLWDLAVGVLACIGIFVLYRKRVFPAADWAVWTLITILPFTYRSHTLIVGPSRHLYLPSVGSSLVLAWVISALAGRANNRLGKAWGHVALVVLTLAILVSSFSALRRTEALSLYSAGRSYIARKNLSLGLQQLRRAVAQGPSCVPVDAYVRMAVVSLARGKSPQSILEQGLTRDPTSPQLNMLLGVSAFLQDNLQIRQQGEKRIRKALELSENDKWLRLNTSLAYNNVAGFYLRTNHYGQAVELYLKALEVRPNYPQALGRLAYALYKQNEIDKAIQVYQVLLRLRPEEISAMVNLGHLLLEQNKAEDAIHVFGRALQVDPSNAAVHYSLAAALSTRSKSDEAVQQYRTAVQLQPDLAAVYRNLGPLLILASNWRETIADLRKLVASESTARER